MKKYIYTVLISFVFWEFGWQSYSTLYGIIIAMGIPDNNTLNTVVKIVLGPISLYLGYKTITQHLSRKMENQKKSLAKK